MIIVASASLAVRGLQIAKVFIVTYNTPKNCVQYEAIRSNARTIAWKHSSQTHTQ